MSTRDGETKLNTGYHVFADINGIHSNTAYNQDDSVMLGAFSSLLSFWQFWNGFKRKQVLKSLPRDVNVRVFRDIITLTTAPTEFVGATWSARISAETDNQMTESVINIVVLFVSERISPHVNSIAFQRRSHGDSTVYSMKIWLEKGQSETAARVSSILRTYCHQDTVRFTQHKSNKSGRHTKLNDKPKHYKPETMRQFEKIPGAQKMPTDLLNADLQKLFIADGAQQSQPPLSNHGSNSPTRSASQHTNSPQRVNPILSNSNSNNSNGAGVGGGADSGGAAALSLHTSQQQQQQPSQYTEHYSTLSYPTNNAYTAEDGYDVDSGLTPDFRRMAYIDVDNADLIHVQHTALQHHSNIMGTPLTRSRSEGSSRISQQLRNEVSRHFGSLHGYETQIIESLDGTLRRNLEAEGCPVCLRNDSSKPTAGVELGDEDIVDSIGEPWVIIKCKLLSCQHVMHLSCAPKVPDVLLKPCHCSSFFSTVICDNKNDFITRTTDKICRNVKIKFQLNHLLSDKNGQEIIDTSVPAKLDDRSNKEYAIVDLDNPNKPYYIPIRRGRMLCDVTIPMGNDNSNAGAVTKLKEQRLLLDSNFDINAPTFNPNSGVYTFHGQIYKLIVNNDTGHILTVYLEEAFLHSKPILKLLSVRYEFTHTKEIEIAGAPVLPMTLGTTNAAGFAGAQSNPSSMGGSITTSPLKPVTTSPMRPILGNTPGNSNHSSVSIPINPPLNVNSQIVITAPPNQPKPINNLVMTSGATLQTGSLTPSSVTSSAINAKPFQPRTPGSTLAPAHLGSSSAALGLGPSGGTPFTGSTQGNPPFSSPYIGGFSPALSFGATPNTGPTPMQLTNAATPSLTHRGGMSPASQSINHLMYRGNAVGVNTGITPLMTANNTVPQVTTTNPTAPNTLVPPTSASGLTALSSPFLFGQTPQMNTMDPLAPSMLSPTLPPNLYSSPAIQSLSTQRQPPQLPSYGGNNVGNNTPPTIGTSTLSTYPPENATTPDSAFGTGPSSLAPTTATNTSGMPFGGMFDPLGGNMGHSNNIMDILSSTDTSKQSAQFGGLYDPNVQSTSPLETIKAAFPNVSQGHLQMILNILHNPHPVGGQPAPPPMPHQQYNLPYGPSPGLASMGFPGSTPTGMSSFGGGNAGMWPGLPSGAQPVMTGTPMRGAMPSIFDQVVNRVYHISKSQPGSRFVQEKLDDPEYFSLFYKELKPHIAELMMDNFGHYAIEALFQRCDEPSRLELLKELGNSMVNVACHKQGSFSIQSIMDQLQSPNQFQALADAFRRDIRKIILNNSGHYVILRFLQKFKWPHTSFIHEALELYTLEFATDHYGLRVMKAAVDAGPYSELPRVFGAVVKHTNTLVENQYGNYIIQHLLDIGGREVTDAVKEKMRGKFVRYSKQKFSSNVVEKCLRHSNAEIHDAIVGVHIDWRAAIVRELLSKTGDLISDKYGNYCLQTALQAATSDRDLLREFMRCCKPHLDHLRENVKAKWIKLLNSADMKSQQYNVMAPPQ